LKPASFAYTKPASLTEALELLYFHRDEGRILAGGQSLIASLNLRLSAPKILIDIAGLQELTDISVNGTWLRIGALARLAAVETSDLVRNHAPLIAEAVPHIAHAAIRNRGTFGGSIALADPAAELPACAVALDAEMELVGLGGTRRVAAHDFFRGLYETAIQPGEILTAVEIPVIGRGWHTAFAEFARRHGDYAIVGLAASGNLDQGFVQEIRLSYFGVGVKPTRADHAEGTLRGRVLDRSAIVRAQDALVYDLDPSADLHAVGNTKLHLARVLLGRVVAKLGPAANR
jgi:aerobic carbon-monoxide dehydrogenase medium subunit